MTITAAPTVPNPNSATFADDAYPFTQWMAALGPEIDAETARINAIGFGAYSATSATSLTVGTGSKSLTIEAGKSFAVGQPVVIASTAGPTNYMTGQVTSYNSGTGALVVNATAIGGSGSVAAWTISIASFVAGGGVSPDSIVVLTSGTSWTCPAGVTRVRVRGVGAGGKAFTSNTGSCSAGGYFEGIYTVVPGNSYTYAIGALAASEFSPGGNTVWNGVWTGNGGTSTNSVPDGGTATGAPVCIQGASPSYAAGSAIDGGSSMLGIGASGSARKPAVGYGAGGGWHGSSVTAVAATAGVIILELYKS